MGRRRHRRYHPTASHPEQLTSRNIIADQEGAKHQGPWNPAQPNTSGQHIIGAIEAKKS
jgi:hypothetical protein